MTESLSTISIELQETWRKLLQRWQETTEVWNDPVRWQFEREFWQPLEVQIKATQEDMKRLVHVITQAQRNVR